MGLQICAEPGSIMKLHDCVNVMSPVLINGSSLKCPFHDLSYSLVHLVRKTITLNEWQMDRPIANKTEIRLIRSGYFRFKQHPQRGLHINIKKNAAVCRQMDTMQQLASKLKFNTE